MRIVLALVMTLFLSFPLYAATSGTVNPNVGGVYSLGNNQFLILGFTGSGDGHYGTIYEFKDGRLIPREMFSGKVISAQDGKKNPFIRHKFKFTDHTGEKSPY